MWVFPDARPERQYHRLWLWEPNQRDSHCWSLHLSSHHTHCVFILRCLGHHLLSTVSLETLQGFRSLQTPCHCLFFPSECSRGPAPASPWVSSRPSLQATHQCHPHLQNLRDKVEKCVGTHITLGAASFPVTPVKPRGAEARVIPLQMGPCPMGPRITSMGLFPRHL